MKDVHGTPIVHRSEGPFPHTCSFCGRAVVSGERLVILEDARVLHETCAFFMNEEKAGGDGD